MIFSIDLDSSSEQTSLLWEMAEQNAIVQGNGTHKHNTDGTGVEDKRDLENRPRQTHTIPSLSRQAKSTTTSLKRKADLDPLDAQAASPSHPIGYKTGSPRPKYVCILYLYFILTKHSRPNAFSIERNLRSRKKAAPDIEPIPSSPANPDEVYVRLLIDPGFNLITVPSMLCYPAGLPGAVNITNADLDRLNPGAFLNDTLIEFGLK